MKYLNPTQTIKVKTAYPLLLANERLLIWENTRGMWKNRQPDPVKELEQMRQEWDRVLPLNNNSQ